MPNLFTDPPSLPLIAPSILSADFARLADECSHALTDANADLLHIDVMDGHFVPNLTMGPALVASLRAALPEAFLDVHIMVTDPGQYIEPFAEAGADHLTFHIEPAADPRAGTGMAPLSEGYDPAAIIRRIHDAGMTAGLAVNPPTPLDPAAPYLEMVDLLLVMSVHPGFSGQGFMSEVLAKTELASKRLRPDQRLQMDGGIAPANAEAVRHAGCDVLVAASAIFGAPRGERARIVQALKG